MRGEPPHTILSLPCVITIRPYWHNRVKHEKGEKGEMHKSQKTSKSSKCKLLKRWKMRNADHDLPLRMRGSIFGLRIGSRGTPWNSKSAGPGGSENAKCRFWSFKWHFALFQGGSIFDTFFVTFSWFWFCWFLMILIFCILSLFVFFWFYRFCHFYCFVIFDHFLSFFVVVMNFDHFLCLI